MTTPEVKVEVNSQTNLTQKNKELEEDNECDVLGCVTDKLIKCPGCSYKSCLKCIQMFILKNNKTECINCKRVYDELHLRNMFSKYWMTKHYTKWRKEKLLESEKSFMIETMEYMDVEKRIPQFKKHQLLCQSELIDVKSKINKLKKDIKMKEKETVSKKLSDEVKEVKKTELEVLKNNFVKINLQFNKLESRINIIKNAIDPWHVQRVLNGVGIIENIIIYKQYTLEEVCQYADSRVDDTIEFNMKTKSATVKTNSYIKPCPAKDCKGFISSKYKCGICEIKICKDCHEIVEEDIKSETEVKTEDDEKDSTHQPHSTHVCNKDNVESAKAILKETKSCPKCAVRVYKIDGCDQMYCTQCHTAFSWATGKVVTGTIHNPHYFEYLRNNNLNIPRFDHPDAQQGGAQAANACLPIRERFVRFINSNKNKFTILTDKVNNEKISTSELLTNIDNIIRLNTHIRRVVIRENQNQQQPQQQQNQHQNQTQVNVERNRDLRIKYLNNEIDEESFMKVVMKRYKEDEYEKSANKVLETFIQVAEDILNDIYYNKINAKFEEHQKETLKNMIFKKKTNNDNNLIHFYMEDLFVDYFKLVNYMNNETDKITNVFDYTTNKYFIKIRNPTNSKYKNIEHLIYYADIENSVLSTI